MAEPKIAPDCGGMTIFRGSKSDQPPQQVNLSFGETTESTMTRYWEDENLTGPGRWTKIPEQARWSGEWKDFRKLPRNDALRYLILWHHKFGDNGTDNGTDNIDVPTELEYLELSWSNT